MNVTVIFPNLEEFHLYKEMGMIPYYGSKLLNWNVNLLCIENDSNKNIQDFRGISIIKFENLDKINKYLQKNSINFEMLILLDGPISLLKLYKKYNSKGITYVKLDNDYKLFEKKYLVPSSEYNFIGKIRKFLRTRRLVNKFNYADMVSIETHAGLNGLKQIFYKTGKTNKFFYLPNGFDSDIIDFCSIKHKDFYEKEKIIFTSGRLGTYQKNTEYFFDILENIKNLKNWKVYFLGSIEKDFQKKVDKFLEKNDYKNKFIFLGNISDRNKYYDVFNRAKIFVLPSRSEGFPLVFPEALNFGNFIVGTPVSGIEDIIPNDLIGRVIPFDDSLKASEVIQELIDTDEKVGEKRYKTIKEHSENFKWNNLIYKIDEKIKKLERF